MLEQVAFTSSATLFQNSTRDVPSMSWYSYKILHIIYIELNELRASILTDFLIFKYIYRIASLLHIDECANLLGCPLRFRSGRRGSGGKRGSGGTRGSRGTRHYFIIIIIFFVSVRERVDFFKKKGRKAFLFMWYVKIFKLLLCKKIY